MESVSGNQGGTGRECSKGGIIYEELLRETEYVPSASHTVRGRNKSRADQTWARLGRSGWQTLALFTSGAGCSMCVHSHGNGEIKEYPTLSGGADCSTANNTCAHHSGALSQGGANISMLL